MSKSVILTGLRANSEFHLGNYLGAMLPMVELQQAHLDGYQFNMFVPDLHSFTTPIDHGTLYQQTIDNLGLFVAAGLNIESPNTYIYRQSYIPAHSELAWILDCFTYFGEASRMIEFKEKSEQHGAGKVSIGLFNYPVLMAADILLYGAEWIPVGEDQRQHIELTRDLALRMNHKFGELFVVPHEWQKQVEFAKRSSAVRIRSLRNPDKKMSKSTDDPAGTILLSDTSDESVKKIMNATTDSFTDGIKFDLKERPGVSNLLQILALLTKRSQLEINREWTGNTSYGELKKAVAGVVRTFLRDFQSKLTQVDQQALLVKLKRDEEMISATANQTLLKVQKAVGLRPK